MSENRWDLDRPFVLPSLHNGFIARVSGPFPIPNAKRLGVWHRAMRERWEVEGYGATPEAARADLAVKLGRPSPSPNARKGG